MLAAGGSAWSRRASASVAAEIYHLKMAGQGNWNKFDAVVDKIDAARSEGLEIRANMYSYTAGSTGLSATMPPWAQEGGNSAFVARLKEPDTRARIIAEMTTPTDDWENFYLAAGPEKILFTRAPEALSQIIGKTLAQVADQRGQPPAEVAADLIVASDNGVAGVYFLMSEENVRKQLRLPWVSFGSDGDAIAPEGEVLNNSTHPRSYGNFARVLGRYVRDEQVLTLTEAIRRMTALPASNLKLKERGQLMEGYFADIAVFDPERIADQATYEKPHQLALGMVYVFINGERVLDQGRHTGALPGRVVRGPGWTGWGD